VALCLSFSQTPPGIAFVANKHQTHSTARCLVASRLPSSSVASVITYSYLLESTGSVHSLRGSPPVVICEIVNILFVVLSGIATSALLYYITSSMLLAQKQLVAANRLQAYLKHWSQWILDNEWFAIFNVGREWSEQEHALIAAHKGPESLVKLRSEKKAFVTQIHQQAGEMGLMKLDRESIQKYIRRLPKEAANIYTEAGKTHVQNLVLGHTFITDEEAATLGLPVIQEAVELKMTVIDLIDRTHLLIAAILGAPDNFPDEDAKEAFGELFWPFVLASRSSTTLLRYTQLFTTRTVTELTLRNIRSGSRFTKR
jgi:hypothetical protein